MTPSALIREKPEWKQCRPELPIEFATVHLDERTDDLCDFTEGRTPCIVAETTGRLVMLVDATELAACDGSPQRLLAAIATNAARHGIEIG